MRSDTTGTGAEVRARTRRVLIVTDTLSNGGMERQLAVLAKALPDAWEVRVVSLGDGVYVPILREAGVPVTVVPRRFRFDVTPAFPLSRIIRGWRPDIVHTYGWMSMTAAYAPCRLAKIPIVDASIQDANMPRGVERLEQALPSRAEVVIANSQAGLDAYGIDPRHGVVVRNGFDPDRWALCVPREKPGRPTRVVMAARMHRHKDFRTYLDAARVLCAEDPGGWLFFAVGSGEERPALLSANADLIESGCVVAPEAGTEVLGLVSGSHIGVLLTNAASHAEGIPNSIMEYMACGLPVVCTDSGGNRELVLEGETGLIVPSGDTDAVVRALRRLRDDPDLAAEMGRAGRNRVATVFTVEALVAGTVAAYEAALSRRGRVVRPGV
jgi:glycosyltransferase involved in cell wall biosynthesis